MSYKLRLNAMKYKYARFRKIKRKDYASQCGLFQETNHLITDFFDYLDNELFMKKVHL